MNPPPPEEPGESAGRNLCVRTHACCCFVACWSLTVGWMALAAGPTPVGPLMLASAALFGFGIWARLFAPSPLPGLMDLGAVGVELEHGQQCRKGDARSPAGA